MSIEAMYPSRHQSRAQNLLFSRAARRRQAGLMLALSLVGLGLLWLQFVPVTARAGAAPVEVKSEMAAVPVRAADQVSKTVRLIQIYTAAN